MSKELLLVLETVANEKDISYICDKIAIKRANLYLKFKSPKLKEIIFIRI